MSVMLAANNEDAAIQREDGNVVSDHPPQTAPYANSTDNQTEKFMHYTPAHLKYCQKLIREDPIHRPYRIAATVATGVALLMSIGSIITAGVMWQRAYSYRGTDADRVLYAALYIFVLAEGCLSFIATLVDFSELFYRPANVLIRDRRDLKFVGRCVTVLLLFLGAVYSFVVPIVLKDRHPKTSPALCLIPGVRLVALVTFFAVLIMDSHL